MDKEAINAPDDAPTILADLINKFHYRYYLIIFLLFVVISSDVFIERILVQFNGATDYKVASSKGVLIQALFFTLAIIAVDAFASQR